MNTYCLNNIRPAPPLNASRLVITGTKPALERLIADAVRKVQK